VNQIRKNFIHKNETFICENCGKEIFKGEGFIRNHCNHCLFSKHVDAEVPGDRLAECGGLMIPISVDYSSKKGYILVFKCLQCKKIINNKVAPDDDVDKIAEYSSRSPLI